MIRYKTAIHDAWVLAPPKERLAQDEGGPSKGGFLNNRLISYADIYIYV